MSFTEFINESWVTLLLTFLPLYYAFVLLKQERIEMIRPKGSKALAKKLRKPYAHDAGMIMLFTGISMGCITIIRLLNHVASLIGTVIVFTGFVVAWKRTYDRYERKV